MLSNFKQLKEHLSIACTGLSAVALIVTTTFVYNSKISAVSGVAGTLSILSLVKSNKEDDRAQLKEQLENSRSLYHFSEESLKNVTYERDKADSLLKPFLNSDGFPLDITGLIANNESLKGNLSQLEQRFKDASVQFSTLESERNVLATMLSKLESDKAQWVKAFDDLNRESEALEKENNQFKAKFESADEIAQLRAGAKLSKIQEKLRETDEEYLRVVNLYNSCREDLVKINSEYASEFKELNEAVSSEIPNAFQSVLDARDQELMRLSGHLNLLIQPHKFDQVGEFARADKIIDILFNSEERLTLDASEIVPVDYTRFEAFYNLRDRKSKGKALIEHLDSLGETIFSELACIKPIKFEFDAVNPHRIKAIFIHKQQKAEPKNSIDKLWIPSSQFDKVAGMLKKPMTRVMGATGEGKGIFVNLLLATEANSVNPATVRLHDPMDSSEEDFWQISKTSKGKSETTKAIKSFVDEFNDRLENGVSTPKTLDVFDEIDIVASSDPGINKELVAASKGMRHNGMRAYVIGQSPSVAKKGMEWSDFDNVNAVYFGTSITTAIDKTPALETQIETLKKTHDKLKDFCQKQNEELGLEGWNEYRIGLLISRGKATFFEMPNADSIVCDWSNLERKTAPSQSEIALSKPGIECQHSASVVRKTYKNEAGDPIRQNRKCKACKASFTVSL